MVLCVKNSFGRSIILHIAIIKWFAELCPLKYSRQRAENNPIADNFKPYLEYQFK